MGCIVVAPEADQRSPSRRKRIRNRYSTHHVLQPFSIAKTKNGTTIAFVGHAWLTIYAGGWFRHTQAWPRIWRHSMPGIWQSSSCVCDRALHIGCAHSMLRKTPALCCFRQGLVADHPERRLGSGTGKLHPSAHPALRWQSPRSQISTSSLQQRVR